MSPLVQTLTLFAYQFSDVVEVVDLFIAASAAQFTVSKSAPGRDDGSVFVRLWYRYIDNISLGNCREAYKPQSSLTHETMSSGDLRYGFVWWGSPSH